MKGSSSTRILTQSLSLLIPVFVILLLTESIPLTLADTQQSGQSNAPITSFTATGLISSWSYSEKENSTTPAPETPYILSGTWQLQVTNGTTKAFSANMTMVKADGTDFHLHKFFNFQVSNKSFTNTLIFNQSGMVNSTLQIQNQNSSLSIPGKIDITTGNVNNSSIGWTNVLVNIMIRHWHSLNIFIDANTTQSHFTAGHNVSVIYGTVYSVRDSEGNELMQYTRENATS